MKTKVIAFANNKGGSGKSTTCSNTGYGLSMLGRKVLLIDGDMQLNLSLSFFQEEEVLSMAESERNLYHALRKQDDLTGYVRNTQYENIDLIPSSTLMSGIEYELFKKEKREYILKDCLKNLKDRGVYDYILIDAPPTLGGLVMNIICASDYMIIPVEASPWGLFGLANMFDFIRSAAAFTTDMRVMGIVVTKVNERKNYFKQTMETLSELKDTYIFKSYIRVDSAIEWAQDNSKPVAVYKKSSRSANEYMELSKEVDLIGSR